MEKSIMWKHNIEDIFSQNQKIKIESFREPGNINGKMTAWNANEPTSRWFKFLLYNRVKEKQNIFFERYLALGETSLGNPISVKIRNQDINLDYLLGLEEFEFIEKNLRLGDFGTVLEIGAGFGRTAHVISELIPSLNRYIIIDLPELLEISRQYLRRVLSYENFSKIEFYSNLDGRIGEIDSDLVININSFQEMTPDVIDFYMLNVIEKSKFFFSRNAIGKYDPSTVGITKTKLYDVMDLGYCREVINIFDEQEINAQIKTYIERYRPNPDWVVVGSCEDMFPYYHNVIYKNNNQN